MSLDLSLVRAAVINYLQTKLHLSMYYPGPYFGNVINPNEEFYFGVEIRNPDEAQGGLALKNIVLQVWVEDDAVAKLLVKGLNPPLIVRSGLQPNSPTLPSDAMVKEMFIFPPKEQIPGGRLPLANMGPGAIGLINVSAKAGENFSGGKTALKARIHAEVDRDWLFPTDQTSSTGEAPLDVVG